MLRIRSLLVTLTVLAAACVAWAQESAPRQEQPGEGAAGKSLLSNGDFRKDNGESWPEGWPHPEGTVWKTEDGVSFLRFEASQPDKMIMAYRQIVLPTPHPPALELRVKARYAELKPGKNSWFDGRVITQFKDKNGKVVKPQPKAPNFRGTSKGWVEKSVFFEIPAQAHILEIMPCLFQATSGTLDLAQCEIFTAREDQLPPPPPMVPSETISQPPADQLPPALRVVGNQLQTVGGEPVWLQGVCVDSLQWSAGGEKILTSIPVAIDDWHANVIRLPVKENFWFGWGPWQGKDNGFAYRRLVDDAVAAAASRGAYVVLDLHQFGAPNTKHVAFWKDAATRYTNHPAVIFELFNEAHSISWKTWKDGGNLKDDTGSDVNAKENNEQATSETTPGMQALVDVVRSTGANNVVIVGGLDWGYDLSGLSEGFELKDREGGHGIVYSSHIYPWKSDWQGKMLDAAAKHPIFIGEVGCPKSWEDFSFIPKSAQKEKLGPDCPWPADMLGLIQKHKLHWTGFSFHPKSGPPILTDWDYNPTPYWGVYVKEALGGKQFEMKSMR